NIRRHIIEKNQLRADIYCLGDLLKRVALDLHGKNWELLADGSKCGGQRTCGQDVIVLDQRCRCSLGDLVGSPHAPTDEANNEYCGRSSPALTVCGSSP